MREIINLFEANDLNVLDYEDCKAVTTGQIGIDKKRKMNTEYWYKCFLDRIKGFCLQKGNTDPIVDFRTFCDDIKHRGATLEDLQYEYFKENTLSISLDRDFKNFYEDALRKINNESKNLFPFWIYSFDNGYEILYIPFVEITSDKYCDLFGLKKDNMRIIETDNSISNISDSETLE